MYNAGFVASVVAEVVYANDRFEFRPGRDDIPAHEIDWDSDDRGHLRLVYAFARMKDGATSKVVVMNRAHIDSIKRSAQGADSQYSPWQTAEPAMWLKSAVRQLAKWVPTSAERAAQPIVPPALPSAGPLLDAPELPAYDLDAEEVDAEIVCGECSTTLVDGGFCPQCDTARQAAEG
jgi:recombination protein RecT